jgi:hypothetical protein
VKMGPPDNQELPKKSLGVIYFEKIKKWNANRVAIVKKRFDFRLIGQVKN